MSALATLVSPDGSRLDLPLAAPPRGERLSLLFREPFGPTFDALRAWIHERPVQARRLVLFKVDCGLVAPLELLAPEWRDGRWIVVLRLLPIVPRRPATAPA